MILDTTGDKIQKTQYCFKPLKRRSKQSCAHRESGQVRAGWKCSLPNGPRRAQSKDISSEYSATWGHTSVAGDMIVSRRAHGNSRESRWHRGNIFKLPSLTESNQFCQGLFCSQSDVRKTGSAGEDIPSWGMLLPWRSHVPAGC